MNALNEYPTPLTDAQADYEWHHVPTVPASYARTLERKLSLCRDALATCLHELESDGRTALSSDGVEQATAALDATK